MGRRYSNINQGTELKRAQEKLAQHRANRQTKRSTGGTVGKSKSSVSVAVLPFSTKDPVLLLARITKASDAVLASALTGRYSKAQLSLDLAQKQFKFQAARIHYFQPNGNQPVYVQSKQTGLYYIKYGGENFSAPFGCLTDKEEENFASRQVKNAVLGIHTNKEYRRVWIDDERVPV
jgi:hypothetical protein